MPGDPIATFSSVETFMHPLEQTPGEVSRLVAVRVANREDAADIFITLCPRIELNSAQNS